MDSARGLYSRLSGYNPDQDLDDELDSLLSLPNVNPNQPREWLHIDGHGKTSYALVSGSQSLRDPVNAWRLPDRSACQIWSTLVQSGLNRLRVIQEDFMYS